VDASQALAYERRSEIVTIRGRRFRISEPRPRLASLILTHLGRLLSPWLRRILGGYVTRFVDPQCPQCGGTKAEQVNGQRWLCQAPDAEGRPCATLWARETLLDESGQPVRLTLAYAMADPGIRQVLAAQVGQAIDDMDPDEAHALALRMVYAGTEWEVIAGQSWVAITDDKSLDMACAQAGIGGMGPVRLAKAHLETWALPSLVDDWTDMSPASPTNKTPGDSEIHEPAPPVTGSAGRAVPRTQKRRG
jgi:hypothetical protein